MKEKITFFWRISSAHIFSYFLVGLLSSIFLNYKNLFETLPYSCFMRPMHSWQVGLGPAFQIIRGLIISFVLWHFREILMNTKNGWLKLWGLLVGLSVLSTASAAPGSVEGLIYTTIPVKKQIIGYFELLPQTLLFSLIVFYWFKYPEKVISIISYCLITVIMMMSLLTLLIKNP
ncbi:MAG: hypothetical protein GXO79_15885 [Chlorobi bacterium]|nr:hypothetical protein [Chlorobiota bacterium]